MRSRNLRGSWTRSFFDHCVPRWVWWLLDSHECRVAYLPAKWLCTLVPGSGYCCYAPEPHWPCVVIHYCCPKKKKRDSADTLFKGFSLRFLEMIKGLGQLLMWVYKKGLDNIKGWRSSSYKPLKEIAWNFINLGKGCNKLPWKYDEPQLLLCTKQDLHCWFLIGLDLHCTIWTAGPVGPGFRARDDRAKSDLESPGLLYTKNI